MKNSHSDNKYTSEIPPLDIIDLDRVDSVNSENTSHEGRDHDTSEDPPLPKNKYAEPDEENFFEKYIFKLNWHIILLLVIAASVVLVIHRISNWGVHVTPEYNPDDYNEEYEIEVQDNILPLIYSGDDVADDGIRTVVALGNSPFADEWGTEDNLAALIEDLTDAVVYNCAVEGSYLTAEEAVFNASVAPMDAFSLYWLTTLACVDATTNIENAIQALGGNLPDGAMEAYETLRDLDFSTVDVITIMYDASDYLDGRPMGTLENPTDIQTYYGNLNASIELIQNTYPHIRIIVMSPTYAYAIDENGEYVSSDLYLYANDALSAYAMIMERSASMYTASFLDNFYGTVNELNADQYLVDNMHLNLEGRKKVAERFVYALEYYD